ncbi:NAD-P-binding protein [Dendrothele bispora CBS 962.96]|uniref:NAD-P-binding protein n=1 Tax=Dendrothele bispora (strain CBS 962.96) TaxID=1314807 RepID=A0A4S8MDK2_DENBC|nr:NAD-P-binding protein [Dendrothele bispora CBS 962.96]
MSEDLQVTERHDIYPTIDPKPHFTEQSYAGKVVLITGASKGIGESIATFYAKAGASLVIAARSQATLDAVQKTIGVLTEVLAVPTDVTETNAIEHLLNATISKFGKLDIVIANAGKADPWDKPFTEKDPNEWWKTVEVNIRGLYNIAHYALPHLDKTEGYFVNISSAAANSRTPFASAYCVSKHAGLRLNEFIAMEHPKVKAFSVHPGSIKTDTSMLNPSWEAYMVDTLQLPAATLLAITSGKYNWLANTFFSSNWDLGEVEKKYKDKITSGGFLVSQLNLP